MGLHLEAHGDVHRREPGQPFGIDPQRIALGVAAEEAVGEHVEARDTQPLGAGIDLFRSGLAIAPVGARACIEQHGHHGEVHAASRDFFFRQRRELGRQRRPAIAPACLEVPPARMERDRRRIGEALGSHVERGLHRGLEAVGIDGEPARPAVLDVFQHLLRALADRRGRAQILEITGKYGRHRCHPERSEGSSGLINDPVADVRSFAALRTTITSVTRRGPGPWVW